MTAVPPAQKRLQPPPMSVASGSGESHVVLTRSSGASASQAIKEEGDEDDIDFVESRPAKRQKISTTDAGSNGDVPNLVDTPVVVGNDETSHRSRFSQVSWQTLAAYNSVNLAHRGQDSSKLTPSLPARPWTNAKARNQPTKHSRPGSRVRQNNAVPSTPDSMVTPPDAPLLEDGRRADYFPWVGKHPEDNLSESTVKSGYYDRAPNPVERELNTAKASLFNAFKHPGGLDRLSALFSLVLDQKSNRGAFSSISSFKGPPPRVTLTEMKRKSWINDLANLAVPLKRLSKTIPQGIRGQALLDQCLTNSVPLSRAIWFAKCVGANEIRTLKRKGINPMVAQGAETKWLREWTMNIEQFLDHDLAQCGHDGWKQMSSYALQFATRLYAENLLDRDHYLEWMVKSLAASNFDQMPFWLLMVDIHKTDLLAFRKRGKQFVESIVTKLNAVHAYGFSEIFQSLLDKLTGTVRYCVRLSPKCYLMPDRWKECKQALDLSLNTSIPSDNDTIRRLEHLNHHVSGREWQILVRADWAGERITDMLDSVQAPFAVESLSQALLEVCPDNAVLVTNCLQWCVSRYRTGSARVYLTVRLCRRWHRSGIEINEIFLPFLQQHADPTAIDLSVLRHLVSELTRSHTLSVSKYIQWLTVRGLPRPHTFGKADVLICTDPTGLEICLQSSNDATQLLTECCVVGGSDHVRNLRGAVLSKGGYDEDNESIVIQRCKDYVDLIIYDPEQVTKDHHQPHFSRLSWAIRSEVAYYARRVVANMFSADHTSPTTPQERSQITFAQFCLLRDVLEQLQDLAILADILRVVAFSKREDILSTVTDTINLHSEAFSAMGALHPLQSLVCRAYLTLRPVKTSMPSLATSLIQMCQQFPMKITPVRALQQDFIRGDRSRAIAACSPFSDGVAESLQQAGETFYDDFEAIMQTESNMSEATLSQLFEVLIGRIEKFPQRHSDNAILLQLCQLLCRLKMCRLSQGDALLQRWVTNRLLQESSTATDDILLLHLVATRCIQLSLLLEVIQVLPPEASSRQTIRHLITVCLTDAKPAFMGQGAWYAVRLAADKSIDSEPTALLEILTEGKLDEADDIVSRLTDKVILATHPSKSFPNAAAAALSAKLVQLQHDRDNETMSEVDEVIRLMDHSSLLAISHLQWRLRTLCQDPTIRSDESNQDVIADAARSCLRREDLSHFRSPRAVQSILNALGPAISAKIRVKLEHDFFDALPKFIHGKNVSYFPLPSVEDGQRARNALVRVWMASGDANAAQQGAGLGPLVERLSAYLKCLTSPTASQSAIASTPASVTSPSSTSTPASPPIETTRAFLLATIETLQLLLQMVCLKRAIFNPAQSQPSPAAAKQNQQDQIKLVGLIISIATNQSWLLLGPKMLVSDLHQKGRDIVEFMFDVAATLVDDMADESRIFCARLLKDKVKDPRAQWLLGSVKMFGSLQFKDITAGLEVHHDSKGPVGEFKPKMWEMLESSGNQNDACLGLGLFNAKHV